MFKYIYIHIIYILCAQLWLAKLLPLYKPSALFGAMFGWASCRVGKRVKTGPLVYPSILVWLYTPDRIHICYIRIYKIYSYGIYCDILIFFCTGFWLGFLLGHGVGSQGFPGRRSQPPWSRKEATGPRSQRCGIFSIWNISGI